MKKVRVVDEEQMNQALKKIKESDAYKKNVPGMRAFIKETQEIPGFFNLTPEEQAAIARKNLTKKEE